MKPEVTVRYFAMFREAAGQSSERVGIEDGTTAAALYKSIAKKYGFALPLSAIRVAVNDEFVSEESILSSNDQIAFIPPVAGG